MFEGSSTGIVNDGGLEIRHPTEPGFAFFGSDVAGVGDVNGDGYADLVVGSRGTAQAFLYLGSSTGLDTGTAQSWTGQQLDESSDHFAGSISGVGDLDQDGFDDVAVGAAADDEGPDNSGSGFVYYGSASGSRTAETTGRRGRG